MMDLRSWRITNVNGGHQTQYAQVHMGHLKHTRVSKKGLMDAFAHGSPSGYRITHSITNGWAHEQYCHEFIHGAEKVGSQKGMEWHGSSLFPVATHH